MWRVRRNDYNSAGFDPACFGADRDRSNTFERKCDFNVGMRVQGRTFSRTGFDDVGGEGCALFFAVEFVAHSDKRQLIEV